MPGLDLFENRLSSLESDGLLSARTASALREAASKPSRLRFSQEAGWLFEDVSSGARFQLHSRRDPAGEAGRQLDAWLASGAGRLSGLVAVFGAGGLVHVQALASRLGPGSRLFVFEPSPELLAAALAEAPSLPCSSPSGVEIRYASHGDFPALMEELRFEMRRLELLEVSLFVHPASARVSPAACAAFEKAFAEKLRHESANRETLVRFSRQWVLNSLANMPETSSSAPAGAFAGAFAGCAAIVVGAGPSLDASIEALRSLKGSFVLLAAGTALKPLLAAGVEPDFVVAVDSDPKTLRQYEGLDLRRQRLAASCNVDPRLPLLFKGRACFFSVNLSAPLNEWFEAGGLLPDRLSAGGTVIVSAADFARLLGCSRIAFCGVDLAMGSGGASHSAGSVYAGRRETGLVPVPGNCGGQVLTTRQFANYIGFVGSFLNDLRERFGVEAFNASCGGAAIAHAAPLDPAALPSLSLASPEPVRAKLDLLLRTAPRLPGGLRANGLAQDAVLWLEALSSELRAALSVDACESSGSEALLLSIESRLRDGSRSAKLLKALLDVELRGFSKRPSAGLKEFHEKSLDASSALLELLRKLELLAKGRAAL